MTPVTPKISDVGLVCTTQACFWINPEDALVRFNPVVLFRCSSGVLQKPVENISGRLSCSAPLVHITRKLWQEDTRLRSKHRFTACHVYRIQLAAQPRETTTDWGQRSQPIYNDMLDWGRISCWFRKLTQIFNHWSELWYKCDHSIISQKRKQKETQLKHGKFEVCKL